MDRLQEPSMGKPDTLPCRADYRTGADNNSNVVSSSPALYSTVYMLEGLEFVELEQDILHIRHLQRRAVQKLHKLFTSLLLGGLNVMTSCTTTVTSIFLMYLSSAIVFSLFAMIPSQLGIQDASNLRAHPLKLLVAEHVIICRPVYLPLQSVHVHYNTLLPPNWKTPTTCNPKEMLEYYQHELHLGTPRVRSTISL